MNIIKHTFKWASGLKAHSTITRIVLHCAATPEGRDYSVEQIHKAHLARKFSGIGYHYVIYRDGTIHEGRPSWATGAHTSGYNSTSIGVCYVGGVASDGKTAKDTRTPQQKEALIELVKYLMERYKVPLTSVKPHYAYAKKACPSFKIETFYKEFKG